MKFEKFASNCSHAFVAALLFFVVYIPLRDFYVPNAAWIAAMFPIGMYYGREGLDNNRNYYETLKASGLSGDEARKIAQGWRGWIPFWHWTWDGRLDLIFPTVTVLALAWRLS